MFATTATPLEPVRTRLRAPISTAEALARIEKRALLRGIFQRASSEELLDRPTAAAGINFSVGYLELAAVRGNGPTMTKIGRKVLYLKQDLVVWLEQKARRVGSTSEASHD
jgi:hypothetical protein